MCVILHLPAKFTPTYSKIENAVRNNPDGWGLIVKDRGRLIVRKECPEGGNKPEEVYQALLDAVGQERFLHVRFNTVGKTNRGNCHPFTVMNGGKGKTHIEFMHNGTIHKYKPSQILTDWSDSRNYSYTYLSTLLNKFRGEGGLGDYTDPFFTQLLGDTFNNMNRGLLVSSKFDTVHLGTWSDIADAEGKFLASNDDYFRNVMASRTREEKKPVHTYPTNSNSSRAPNTRVESNTVAKEPATGNKEVITKLQEVNLVKRAARILTTMDFKALMSWGKDCPLEELDDEDLSYFSYVTKKEWEQYLVSDVNGGSVLLEYVFERFNEMKEEFIAADEQRVKALKRHEAATNAMSVMAKELQDANAEIRELTKALDAKKVA